MWPAPIGEGGLQYDLSSAPGKDTISASSILPGAKRRLPVCFESERPYRQIRHLTRGLAYSHLIRLWRNELLTNPCSTANTKRTFGPFTRVRTTSHAARERSERRSEQTVLLARWVRRAKLCLMLKTAEPRPGGESHLFRQLIACKRTCYGKSCNYGILGSEILRDDGIRTQEFRGCNREWIETHRS